MNEAAQALLEELSDSQDWIQIGEESIQLAQAWDSPDATFQIMLECLEYNGRLYFCFCSPLRTKAVDEKKEKIRELISLFNLVTTVGGFVLEDDGEVVFRYAFPLSESTSPEHLKSTVEGIVSSIFATCGDSYPLFQKVIWADLSPAQAQEIYKIEPDGTLQ